MDASDEESWSPPGSADSLAHKEAAELFADAFVTLMSTVAEEYVGEGAYQK